MQMFTYTRMFTYVRKSARVPWVYCDKVFVTIEQYTEVWLMMYDVDSTLLQCCMPAGLNHLVKEPRGM